MQLTAAGRSGRFSKMHGTLRTTMPLRDSIRKIDVKHSDGNNLNRGVKYSEYDAFFSTTLLAILEAVRKRRNTPSPCHIG